MNANTTLKEGSVYLNQGPFVTVAEAAQALTDSPYYRSLVRMAERRIQRLAKFPPGQRLRAVREAQDFANEALSLVLLGEAEPGRGRRTKPHHLETLKAFLNHVQGVLQSCVSSAIKSVVREGEVLALCDDPQAPHETDVPVDSPRQRELAEVVTNVFAGLQHTDDKDSVRRATLKAWAEDWQRLQTVPQRGLTKRQRHQLRGEAAARLRGEALRGGFPNADGSELLL